MISILPESLDDLMKCLSVFALGGIVIVLVGQMLRIRQAISLGLYVWHSFFCIAYAYIAIKNGGDAIGYYLRSFDLFLQFDLGTNAIVAGVSYLTVSLGFSFIATSLVFNMFGAVGLVLFLAAIKETQKELHWSSWLVILLPSVSFWSAGVGKDPLSFFASALFAWWVASGGIRVWPMVFALVIMGLARPHIAIVMAAAGTLFSVIQARQSPIRAAVGLLLVVSGGIYLLPIVLQKMNIETLNLEDIGGVIEGRESQNLMGGSSIEISGMPPYLKIFTYLFRPMPFEAADALQLLSGVENIILLIIISIATCFYLTRPKLRGSFQLIPLLLLGVFLTVFLSFITANLGIAVRQKWMALVPLLIFLSAFLEAKRPLKRAPQYRVNRYPTPDRR